MPEQEDPHHIMQLLELTRTITILPTENTVLKALCAMGMVSTTAPQREKRELDQGTRDSSDDSVRLSHREEGLRRVI